MRQHLFSLILCFLPMAAHAEDFSITLKENEKATIQQIVAAFGEKDEQLFMRNAGNLMPQVMSLMEISPFQIIGYILTEDDLRETFLLASKSPLKWGLFTQAFHIKMEQEHMMGNVAKHIGSFAEYLSLDAREIENLVEHHAWGELAMYALHRQ